MEQMTPQRTSSEKGAQPRSPKPACASALLEGKRPGSLAHEFCLRPGRRAGHRTADDRIRHSGLDFTDECYGDKSFTSAAQLGTIA